MSEKHLILKNAPHIREASYLPKKQTPPDVLGGVLSFGNKGIPYMDKGRV
ncbi:hypothetical protein SAMN04488055_4637 [Chitinophaga niabensis]|uniref:Uncharacterized protein n=1 Tax=Chitinophaga niabensis TaxID=536979 RepID=A0A1N6JXA9_9BACT|nr:hypothetical protein SAMN04488055_4637 [Chitinophaga niabensis]